MNQVNLLGRLGKDPEMRFTGTGKGVCNFSLATDESYRDESGEKHKKVEWHNIVVWGKTAETIQKYFKKGSEIFLTGKLQTREWDDREGQKRKTTEILLLQFSFTGGSRVEGASESAEQPVEAPAVSDEDPF